jgi:hypothetical protein
LAAKNINRNEDIIEKTLIVCNFVKYLSP